MAKINVWIAALLLLVSLDSYAAPLMPAENFVPSAREASSLTSKELRQIEDYRKDSRHTSARLFRANMEALRSDVVDVEAKGKSQRYVAWDRSSLTQDPKTQAIEKHGPDYPGAVIYFWTGSTSLPAKGRPTAQFSWSDQGLSGQFLVDGAMYSIATIGRFHVLLSYAQPLDAIPGTEPHYVCVDSTGARAADTKPVLRCDRPQRLRAEFAEPGPPIPATLTKAEGEPFERLHPKLRVSPLNCGPDEVTHCEGMVRISCNAGGDAPVLYFDNASAELLGTCGHWVRNPACMPQRWKVCAIKNGVRHIGEEPDPSR